MMLYLFSIFEDLVVFFEERCRPVRDNPGGRSKAVVSAGLRPEGC